MNAGHHIARVSKEGSVEAMRKDSRIYVAGHAGLLGSALVLELKRQGFPNLLARSRDELDLTDAVAVRNFFATERPDYVFMAAGKVGGIVANRDYPADFIHENLAIEINVIRNAYLTGAKKLIFFASSCMYPRLSPQPMKEEYLATGEVEPTSKAYSTAKFAGLEMCQAYNRQYGTKFITAIPNTMYGPNDDFDPESSHVLPALIRKFHEAKVRGDRSVTLWGTGSPRREFVHVDDVARASLFLMQADLSFDLLNVGCGVDYAIREVAGIVKQVVGFEGEIVLDTTKPDGAPRKLLDARRIASLGWKPQVAFENGVRETYQWFLRHSVSDE